MEPSTQSLSSERVDDRLFKFLDDILQAALLEEVSLNQQLDKVASDIRDCRFRMRQLGLKPDQESTSHNQSNQPQSVLEAPASNLVAVPVVNLSRIESPQNETGSSNTSNQIGASSFTINSYAVLSILASKTHGFTTEVTTQAYRERMPEVAAVDYNILRIKIGKTLSRLAYKKKVVRFQLKGRPSQVRYLSTDWFDKEENILSGYEDILEGLEPVITKEGGQAELDNDDLEQQVLAINNANTTEPVSFVESNQSEPFI